MTEVVIDCHDHGAVVDFWQEALGPGYTRREVNEQYVALVPPRGVHVSNQFGAERLDVLRDVTLCVPSTLTPKSE